MRPTVGNAEGTVRQCADVAVVRVVPDTYAQGRVTFVEKQQVDVDLARRQHRTYVSALEELGFEVVRLPADNRYPDSCFVEDTAVLLDDVAIISHMGAPTRNGEQSSVAECLAQRFDVIRMEPPACLEGGDVLKVDRRLLVGESGRTNRAGFEFLRQIAVPRGYEVVTIPVHGALHLKSVMSYLGSGTLVAVGPIPTMVQTVLKKCKVIEVAESCAYVANVLCVGETVIMARGYPAVARAIAERGFALKELDLSEFRKREGGPTCLSLILN